MIKGSEQFKPMPGEDQMGLQGEDRGKLSPYYTLAWEAVFRI